MIHHSYLYMDYRSLLRRCHLEQEIIKEIYSDNQATCHFHYEHREIIDKNLNNLGPMVILTLITCNPKHSALFTLYTSDPQETEEKCLDQAISYLHKIREKDSGFFNYRVTWVDKNNSTNSHQSYFWGSSFMDVMGKFFENKDEHDYIIREVILMPES